MNQALLRFIYSEIDRRLDEQIKPIEKNLNRDVTGEVYGFPQYTVANLPNVTSFMVAYATDGRKSGETVGNGTGIPVWYNADSSEWLSFWNNTVVQD